MPRYTGTLGPDRIEGSDFDDVIIGRGGDDYVDGRGGDDVIYVDGGRSTILGGTGNDQIFLFGKAAYVGNSHHTDRVVVNIIGGEGFDTVDATGIFLQAPAGVSYQWRYDSSAGTLLLDTYSSYTVVDNRRTVLVEGTVNVLTMTGVEILVGTREADYFNFTNYASGLVVDGGDGNDVMMSGAGSDTFLGGAWR